MWRQIRINHVVYVLSQRPELVLDDAEARYARPILITYIFQVRIFVAYLPSFSSALVITSLVPLTSAPGEARTSVPSVSNQPMTGQRCDLSISSGPAVESLSVDNFLIYTMIWRYAVVRDFTN